MESSSSTPTLSIDTPITTPLCERSGCTFLKNENIHNNGGTHCCKMCKTSGKHGPLCSSKKESLLHEKMPLETV